MVYDLLCCAHRQSFEKADSLKSVHSERLSVPPSYRLPLALVALALALWGDVSPAIAATPVLVRTVDGSSNPPTSDGIIKFHNVGYTDGGKTFFSSLNPILTGNNIYATDLLRVDNGGIPAWRTYRGAWQLPGDVNDRIYQQTSDDLDPGGPWTPWEIAVDFGEYIHVNDPSVVFDQGVYTMAYTTLKAVPGDPNGVKDWINYSTSTDGINWTPSAGSTSTEIGLSDPNNLAPGTVGEIARPALVKTDTGWQIWFDALTDEDLSTERRDSYLAESTDAAPTDFEIIHRYRTVNGGFPGFFEPDVAIRPDGTYLAVVQRNFAELWQATSTDGINFSFFGQPILDIDDPTFTRDFISNPGLMYDQVDGVNYGVSFGMTDSTSLVDHDIGFAYSQYIINVRSPGDLWHTIAASELMVDQLLSVFDFDEFNLVRVIDPLTGAVVLEQDFTSAQPGDTWELRFLEPTNADFDRDNDVDGNDFLRWQRGQSMLAGASRSDGDADGDTDVDDFDLNFWQDNFGYDSSSSATVASTAVPEPSTTMLVLIGLFLVSDRRALVMPRTN